MIPVRKLFGQYTAGNHSFGADMVCVRCCTSWARHQATGEQCTVARTRATVRPDQVHVLQQNPDHPMVQRRLVLRLRQAEFARLIGTSPDRVSRWERGAALPLARFWQPIEHALGVPIRDLFPKLRERAGVAPVGRVPQRADF